MVKWTKFEPPEELPYDPESEEWEASYRKRTEYIINAIQPGTLVRLGSGKIMLIGDINRLFGTCDCCQDFGEEDIEEFSLDLVKVVNAAKGDEVI